MGKALMGQDNHQGCGVHGENEKQGWTHIALLPFTTFQYCAQAKNK